MKTDYQRISSVIDNTYLGQNLPKRVFCSTLPFLFLCMNYRPFNVSFVAALIIQANGSPLPDVTNVLSSLARPAVSDDNVSCLFCRGNHKATDSSKCPEYERQKHILQSVLFQNLGFSLVIHLHYLASHAHVMTETTVTEGPFFRLIELLSSHKFIYLLVDLVFK